MANRDEFYDRPTAAAHWWTDHKNILGGRDLTHHGSWLAITRQGKFAAITNYRDPLNIKSDAPSRGNLLKDFLTSSTSAEDYLKVLEETGKAYNGFNLLFGNQDQLIYYSNYAKQPQTLSPGQYGLSNSLLDTPWPKVIKGKTKLANLLQAETPFAVNAALEALKDNLPAMDKDLPDTGVGMIKEKLLSPMFIESPIYGSRCSTILTINHNNEVNFHEISYIPENSFHTTFQISN